MRAFATHPCEIYTSRLTLTNQTHMVPVGDRSPAFTRRRRMKYIVAVVRPERLSAVKEALFRVAVTGMTITRVSGHGGEHEVIEHYRGSSVVLEFRDKVRIEMAVSEPFVEPTVRAILEAAQTGDVGDGKIFVQPLERVIRIRTGEENVDALTPITATEVQM